MSEYLSAETAGPLTTGAAEASLGAGEDRPLKSLTDFLYPMPARRSVGGIVKWWEKRRLAYNLAVGSAGLVSVGLVHLFLALPPNGFLSTSFEWWPVPVAFGLVANVCYLFGPTVEILVEKLFRGQVLPTGPALYRIGLTFSMGLALFPALLMMFFWFFRIVGLAW